MILCLTHRENDWESQLERATHRGLLAAPSMDLLSLLQRHGWDGLHFRRLRDPDALVEPLDVLLRVHQAQSGMLIV